MDDMYNILPDDITNFKELEEWYDKFKAMPYRTQLQSNDISLSVSNFFNNLLIIPYSALEPVTYKSFFILLYFLF